MGINDLMQVEVFYITDDQQWSQTISLPRNALLKTALVESELFQFFPSLKIDELAVGIYAKPADLQTILKPDDRVEIYQPLRVDPKTARRLKAKIAKMPNVASVQRSATEET